MTESSFPLVAADFTSDEWSQTVSGLGNGVLDDWGSPYAITLNTNDTATIAVSTVSGVARAVVAGFGHRLTAAVTLSIPAVATTTTYTIGLLYDPAQASTPVLLTVMTGTVTLTPGQVWLPLHVIVRQASQALTSATLSTPMLKLQPRASVASEAALKAQSPRTYLAGTTVFCVDTGNTLQAGGTPSAPVWAGLQVTGALTYTGIYSSSTTSPVALVRGGSRAFSEGLVQNSIGSFAPGNNYLVGTVPAGFAPAHDKQFITRVTGGGVVAVAYVIVQAGTGSVLFSVSATFTSVVLNLSLDGLNWRTA